VPAGHIGGQGRVASLYRQDRMNHFHFDFVRSPVSATLLLLLLLGTAGCTERQYPSLQGAPEGFAEILEVNSAESSEVHQTEGTFLALAQQANRVVLVDFWGPHCETCRHLAKELEEIAKKNPDKVSVVKVDLESAMNADLAMFFEVRTIPEMRIFVDGQSAGAIHGYTSASQITQRLEPAMKLLESQSEL